MNGELRNDESAVLRAENLTYVYGEGTPFRRIAVDNVSFSVRRSSVTGIIGHTGSGKSTAVQMLNGLLKPFSGRVLLDGNDIFENKKTLREARFKVGLVFQYPEYQLFEETVRKDIAFGPRNMGLSEAEIAERITAAAEFAGLENALFDKSPFELSGGQKRRVAIAGVMAMMPSVLVLDEPASGLDPVGRRTVFRGLLKYRETTGATIVIVSHSMEDMAEYADDLIVFEDGRILMQGTRDEVFSHPDELIRSGLDMPQVSHIAIKLREMGVKLPDNIYTVDAAEKAITELYRS